MGIVRRETEHAVDPLLQLLREHVLEPLGLVVDVVHVEPQRLGQVQLQQPMVADDLECDLLPRGGQRYATVRLVNGELEGGELLHHCAGRGRRDGQPLRERRNRHAPVLGAELVDLPEVVLDSVG